MFQDTHVSDKENIEYLASVGRYMDITGDFVQTLIGTPNADACLWNMRTGAHACALTAMVIEELMEV